MNFRTVHVVPLKLTIRRNVILNLTQYIPWFVLLDNFISVIIQDL